MIVLFFFFWWKGLMKIPLKMQTWQEGGVRQKSILPTQFILTINFLLGICL